MTWHPSTLGPTCLVRIRSWGYWPGDKSGCCVVCRSLSNCRCFRSTRRGFTSPRANKTKNRTWRVSLIVGQWKEAG
eukprot:1110598-Amphidinium_carterae.1